MQNSTSTAAALVCLALLTCACGGSVELSPEISAHLDEYERIIEQFEPKFESVRGDGPRFAGISASYTQETKAWMSRWTTIAPDLSDEEGKAIKAIVDKLNRRAEKMLLGS